MTAGARCLGHRDLRHVASRCGPLTATSTCSLLTTGWRDGLPVTHRHFGHSLSKVKQARYGTRGSWWCAWAYVPSRDVAIDEAPRAGGDERAGVGDSTSGRGPQRGVSTLAGPPGDDAEHTAW
jgi:hypothetical protein